MQQVPNELRDLKQWVLWKTVNRGGRATKVPYQATGAEAKSNDSATWNWLEGLRFNPKYDGVGFVFSDADPFCGIDLDGCRNPQTGKVEDWAKSIINDFKSYAEVSPSQTGVKIFIRGKLPFDTGKKKILEQARKVSEKTPEIEIYDHKRYFAVTGQRLQGMPSECRECQDRLDALCKVLWPAKVTQQQTFESDLDSRAAKYIDTLPPAIAGQSGHNQTFRAACVLVLGFGMSPEQAMPIMQQYNQRCEPPWSERELTHKLESADQQAGDRGYLRDKPLEQLRRTALPNWKEGKNEKQKASKVVSMFDEIANYGDTLEAGETGLWHTGLSDLDVAIGGGFELGEMIVVGARPSHGKSVFGMQCMLNLAADGLSGLYISEEMSKRALAKRCLANICDIPQEDWFRCAAGVKSVIAKRSSEFAPCYIAESCNMAETAYETIRREVSEHDVKVVVVDYSQLLRSKGANRYEQISNTSILLRHAATDFNIVVFALAQLSRDIEKRNEFSPKLGDLKESGQFEQDADVVLFLTWPYRIDREIHPHEYRILIAKNRNRPIVKSQVDCKFRPSRQMIYDSNF